MTITDEMVERGAIALYCGRYDDYAVLRWEALLVETKAEAEAQHEKNLSEGHHDYGYPGSREAYREQSRDCLTAALAPATADMVPGLRVAAEMAEIVAERFKAGTAFGYAFQALAMSDFAAALRAEIARLEAPHAAET